MNTRWLMLGALLGAAAAFGGDKQPQPKPASVLPGCACASATQLPGGQGLVFNCTCPGDDGRPLQCVVGVVGGANISVSCAR